MTKIGKVLLRHNKFVFLITAYLHSSLSFSQLNVQATGKNECEENVRVKKADMDSLQIYPELNFKAKWTRDHKHFWKSTDYDFETRYIKEMKQGAKWPSHFLNKSTINEPPQVKVFVIPFSHNDPGWKQTYEVYFYSFTKKILTNAINKLTELKNMTFVWSEVSFLSKWWDEASYGQKEKLRRLVREGRFEILTGGWVMADEATTTVFALVSQLIEGHQWVKMHLGLTAKSAWSIDSFGHSSTMPYLLKQAGIDGMMIQRVHYAWKHWFAEHRQGDFVWLPRWSSNPEMDGIVCHNAHYDLYPTKHSCGPNPNICMRFDFRMVDGVREEQRFHVKEVDATNIHNLADYLTGQYRRTASLTKHNTVLTSLGGDFRFDHNLEWNQQHNNYKLLSDYINSRKRDYNTNIRFGTLSEYFREIKERNMTIPTFSGDFFPYTDVIFPFAPGHWTGYYSTRPFWKKLGRETEDELLKAEIIFTFAYNLLRQHNLPTEVLFRNYDNLVHARRSLALFQHHDGITGTSPRSTMMDFAKKLTQAWNFCRHIQRIAIENIWSKHLRIPVPPLGTETKRNSYTVPAEKVPIRFYENANIVKKMVVYNSLPWERTQLVRLLMKDEHQNIAVRNSNGDEVTAQISPISSKNSAEGSLELVFVAKLPPLSVVTFEVFRAADENNKAATAVYSTLTCKNCNGQANSMKDPEIILDNGRIKAFFDKDQGLLERIEDKRKWGTVLKSPNITLSFGRYDSIYGSGAYLLHPFTSSPHSIIDSNEASLYVMRGPVISQVVLVTPKIILKSWVLHVGSPEQMSVVYISIEVNGTDSDSFGEYFMRFQTDLNNTETATDPQTPFYLQDKPSPVLFTDTNSFSVEKRVTVGKLPYQANHFPITNYAFIQDTTKNLRFSLLVDRAHGVSSVVRGRLEVIFDRRLRYDDARGMEEGVIDMENAISNYIISLEHIHPLSNDHADYNSWQPSLAMQKLAKFLNHQPTIFIYDALSTHKNGKLLLFSQPFPDDVHLLNLQTLSGSDHLEDIKSVPSTKALLILQRLSHHSNTSINKSRKLPFSRVNDHCNHSNSHQHDSPPLNATLLINHHTKRTNLVGTKEAEIAINNEVNLSAETTTTKNIPVGGLHELSTYLVQF